MPDFDVFPVLECKNRKSRSHDKRKNGNIKRKICTEKRLNTSLKDLSLALTNHGRHGQISPYGPRQKSFYDVTSFLITPFRSILLHS